MSVNLINETSPCAILNDISTNELVKHKIKLILPDTRIKLCLVHLNTIFKKAPNDKIIDNVENSTLIHCVAGLFDICLPDMDLDTIYNSIGDEEAFTIIAYLPFDVAEEKLKRNLLRSKNKKETICQLEKALNKFQIKETVEDIYETESTVNDDFSLVFTQTNSDSNNKRETSIDPEDNETDDEPEENYSRGYISYMREIYSRKIFNLQVESDKKYIVGLEERIIGCLSFKIRSISVRRITHITMLGVMSEYRSAGLGRKLLNLAINPDVTGRVEAVVVHADYNASDFFKKAAGFSDDALLNLQWHELEPEYTNCSLLSLVPAYSWANKNGQTTSQLSMEYSSAEMEVEIKVLQRRSVENHCFQAHLYHRMKQEIQHLKDTIKSQDETMKDLMRELRESNREKTRLEKYLKSNMSGKTSKESKKSSKSTGDSLPNDSESKLKILFENEMNKFQNSHQKMEYLKATMSNLPSLIHSQYKATKTSLEIDLAKTQSKERSTNTRILFFCENFATRKQGKLQILTQGFSANDCKTDIFGHGYYFTNNPYSAALFSSDNSLLLAEVCLGRIIAAPAASISDNHLILGGSSSAPDDMGHNSLKLCRDNNHQFHPSTEEFLVVNSAQCLPLALIEYSFNNK